MGFSSDSRKLIHTEQGKNGLLNLICLIFVEIENILEGFSTQPLL